MTSLYRFFRKDIILRSFPQASYKQCSPHPTSVRQLPFRRKIRHINADKDMPTSPLFRAGYAPTLLGLWTDNLTLFPGLRYFEYQKSAACRNPHAFLPNHSFPASGREIPRAIPHRISEPHAYIPLPQNRCSRYSRYSRFL